MKADFSEALEVVLRNLRPFAPPFHRHIVRKKMLGCNCQVGDQVVIYEVVDTVPKGLVRVTDSTQFRFE